MNSSWIEIRYDLGSVALAELSEVLDEVNAELEEPASTLYVMTPPSVDLSGVSRIQRGDLTEGDGGVLVALLLWGAGYVSSKVLDFLIDDVVRPRLRDRFDGRDLGPKAPAPLETGGADDLESEGHGEAGPAGPRQ